MSISSETPRCSCLLYTSKTSPVPIAFENIEGGSHGYYHLEDKRIAINEGMSELQTLKTTIHEIAHAKLHDIDLNAPKDEQQPRVDRRTREVEAESVAYTVCQHYGLDTSDYSFGYVEMCIRDSVWAVRRVVPLHFPHNAPRFRFNQPVPQCRCV